MYYGSNEQQKTTICKLDSGEILEYNACSKKPDAYNPVKFEMFGYGIICSIGGTVQAGTEKYYFYRKLF